MNSKLSIVILTKNSQKYLKEVLKSASFADETVVVDNGSTDNTLKIAKEFDTKIVIQNKWLGFGSQKQLGIDNTNNSWVFILDSDEIITKKLQQEILSTIQNPKFDGYKVARLNYFFGKPLRYGGLYPDYTVRLFNKNRAYMSSDRVHERVIVKGDIYKLKNHMIHYAYDSVEQFISKQNHYSTLGAKPNKIKAIFNPLWSFIRMYIIKLGFLDGWHGYIVARLYAQYTLWKYIKPAIITDNKSEKKR